jgi:excisionase family DNA binding protein
MAEYLTPKQVADKLKLSYDTIMRLIHREELPAVKIGQQWRISTDALEEWIRARARTGEGA